jgi:hypothetical protein
LTINGHVVALWLSIVGTACGIYFPVQSQINQERSAEAVRINARQHAMDALYKRLSDDEAAIAVLASQMPQDKRDLLNAIHASEKRSEVQPQVTFYDKSLSFDEPRKSNPQK